MKIGDFDIDKKADEINRIAQAIKEVNSGLFVRYPDLPAEVRGHIQAIAAMYGELAKYSQEQTEAVKDLTTANAQIKHAYLVQKQINEGKTNLN
jgi:hypothetical protein